MTGHHEDACCCPDEPGHLDRLLAHASDLVLVVDLAGVVTYASPPTRAFLGHEPVGSDVAGLAPRVDRDDLVELRAASSSVRGRSGAVQHLRVRARRHDGRRRDLAVTLTGLAQDGRCGGFVVNARDVTDELNVRARLDDHVARDGLTGLGNRATLLDGLRAWCVERRAPFALVVLDVTGMAGINDRIGHLNGDVLLRSLARRLADAAPDGALVARTSGDEFAVALPDVDDEAAVAAARRLLAVVQAPVVFPGGAQAVPAVRAAVALSRQSSPTPGSLMRDAALALTDLRRGHDDDLRLCDDDLCHRHRRRLALEHGLHAPELGDQLELSYQPVISLRSGRIRAVEALVRWHHPELGKVWPGEFVPVAELSDAITVIGTWVLEQACTQLAQWHRAGITDVRMAVNVSPRQLLDRQFPTLVARVLGDTGVAAELLVLEVTETALADRAGTAVQTLDRLVDLGVRIHIDDFGSGWSSFEQLRRLRFHGLKLDRSFVEVLGTDQTTDVIVAGILAIARDLRLHVIGEGVETDRQRTMLAGLGCDAGQGFLWSTPRPAADVGPLLAEQQRAARALPSRVP